MPTNNQASNRPVHQVRWGALKAAIWSNTTEKGARFYNVTVTRSYKDGEEWKDTTAFGFDDLLTLSKMLDVCHTWIHEATARDSKKPEAQQQGNQRPNQRQRGNG